MSNTLIAFMFGVGFGGWVYYKMMQHTGNNSQASWTVAVLSGLAGAFVIYTLFAWVLPQPA